MITVHDSELCSELLGFKTPVENTTKNSPKRNETSRVTPRLIQSRSGSQNSLSRSNTHSQLLRAQDWLSRKARRAIVALPTDPYAKTVGDMCDALERERQEILKEIDHYLATQSQYKQCKREMLYQKWSDQVFTPLVTSIDNAFNSTFTFNDHSRRLLFDQYLQLKNRKNVFLETISPIEYNPLRMTYTAPTGQIEYRIAGMFRGVKVSSFSLLVPKLNDPLISSQKDHTQELAVMHHCDVGMSPDKSHDLKTPPTGRTDTDPLVWLAMKIIQINSEERTRSRQCVKDYQGISGLNTGSGLVKDKGDKNTTEPILPHKIPICYPREKLSLKWESTDKETN